MEKSTAKAELNIYGIATIYDAENKILPHYYATYHEACRVLRERCGDGKFIPPEDMPKSQNPDFIHKFIIRKGGEYIRDGILIYSKDVCFIQTIKETELYGKNKDVKWSL